MHEKLSERSSGFYRVLRNPHAYSALQRALVRGSETRMSLVRRHIRPAQDSTILDFGAGTGTIRETLPASARYIAIEPNPSYCHAMRTLFGNDGSVVECGGVEALERFREAADLVLILAVLHHVDDDEARRIVKAARAALRPHGRLVTVDPCFHDKQNPVARLLARLDRGPYVRTPERYTQLVGAEFREIQMFVETNNLRVPYSHCILECNA
jgi:SAM-dependent methyltransferase